MNVSGIEAWFKENVQKLGKFTEEVRTHVTWSLDEAFAKGFSAEEPLFHAMKRSWLDRDVYLPLRFDIVMTPEGFRLIRVCGDDLVNMTNLSREFSEWTGSRKVPDGVIFTNHVQGHITYLVESLTSQKVCPIKWVNLLPWKYERGHLQSVAFIKDALRESKVPHASTWSASSMNRGESRALSFKMKPWKDLLYEESNKFWRRIFCQRDSYVLQPAWTHALDFEEVLEVDAPDEDWIGRPVIHVWTTLDHGAQPSMILSSTFDPKIEIFKPRAFGLQIDAQAAA